MIYAIDPGNVESAMVTYDEATRMPVDKCKVPNLELEYMLVNDRTADWARGGREALVIEMIASYGMPVGATIFETVYWIGRFARAWDGGERYPNRLTAERIYRLDVKKHLCKTGRGVKDSNIRQALIDRYGPSKREAIGLKKTPGPLYGYKADHWAALAVAVTYADSKDAPF